MNENIVKIQFGEMGSTGIVIYSDKDNFAVIVTAGHCLKKMDNNLEEIEFQGYNESEVIGCVVAEEADVAFLISSKFPYQEVLWKFKSNNCNNISKACVKGFPTNKESEKDEYEGDFTDIQYQELQKLYIGKFKEDIGEEKSNLMNGMSGSPVYDQESKELYGMYLGSLEKNYNYNENRILPISVLLRLASKHDVIYFRKGINQGDLGLYNKRKYLNVSPNSPLDLTKYRNLNFLLLGKSGNGKSAFIKSFLKHKDLIHSTGEGRTTRINCEYKVIYGDYKRNEEICVIIKFYDKSTFADSRWKMIEDKIKDAGDSCEVGTMFEILCYDEGFFSIDEFDDNIQKEIEKIFEETFKKNENERIEIKICDDDELQDIQALINSFYEKCFSFIKDELNIKNRKINLEDFTEDEIKFLEICINEVEGKTYAGLVDKIEVYDRICDEYCYVCEELNIRSILFVDTYGLDHVSDDDRNKVKKRLHDLICTKYEKIKNVLYIRKLNSDSPNDLEYYLPALYEIDPNVILNVVFTEIDKNDYIAEQYDEKLDINLIEFAEKEFINSRSVKYFIEKESNIKYKKQNELKQAIHNGVKSEAYAEAIFGYILKYLTPYCSAEGEIYDKYLTNNCKKVKRLFNAIINEEYRGNGIISTKRCREHLEKGLEQKESKCYEIFRELISGMFKNANMIWEVSNYHRGHWKTKQANITCIQRLELGYCGTHDDRWSSSFKQAYFKFFSTLDKEQFQILFGEEKETNSGISIQTILNSFITKMIGCEKQSQDFFLSRNEDCEECDSKNNCFKYKLLNTYVENELENGNVETRESWLNARTNFTERFKDNEQMLMNYFTNVFLEIISEFKKYNLIKIEKALDNEENKENIDKYLGEIKKSMQAILKNECEMEDEILLYMSKRYKDLK